MCAGCATPPGSEDDQFKETVGATIGLGGSFWLELDRLLCRDADGAMIPDCREGYEQRKKQQQETE